MTGTTAGRRERKKAQTRQALTDAAVRLFTERGFDNVGVREVAEAADVSLSTLFKHFPSKEALVFDLDTDMESALVAAVRDRASGQPVLHALRDHMVRTRTAVRTDDPTFVLIESTPRCGTTPGACGRATRARWPPSSPRSPGSPRKTPPSPAWHASRWKPPASPVQAKTRPEPCATCSPCWNTAGPPPLARQEDQPVGTDDRDLSKGRNVLTE